VREVPVWTNPVEEAAFREKTCLRCYQPDEARKRITGQGDGCPLLATASTGRLPTQWTPRRNAVMGDTYRCAARIDKPPSIRHRTSSEQTEGLFEVEPAKEEKLLIPVDGWPDFRAEQRKSKEGDHQ